MGQANEAATAASAGFGSRLRQWRRKRKLSQLELALVTDVSQRHLSFLESGRARPSRAMVLQLVEALEVPFREANALLHAAGFASAFRQRELDDEAMAPAREALELILRHHEPYPAMVVDRDWNLLMGNAAVARVLGSLGDADAMWRRVCGDGPRNVMRLTLSPQGLRPFIANWREAAPMLVHRLQREVAGQHSETLRSLLSELRADPDVPGSWHALDPERPLAPVLPLDLALGPARLSLLSMISTFGTPQDVTTDELRVETFFPADAATAELLRGAAGRAVAD